MKKTLRTIRTLICITLSITVVSTAVLPPIETFAAPKDYFEGQASTIAEPASETAPATQKSNGLVLVYFNGTDLETNNQSGTEALNNMLKASESGNTRFVLLAGGTKKWSHPAMQSANNGAIVSYVVENGKIRELKKYEAGEKGKNYLTSGMISEFVKDATSTYSSDHTSMFFWDHGGGAAGGYGVNETAGGGMSAAAVGKGIKDSGVKFEAVGFDTCLMGSLEIASNFTDVAKYYIGSQEIESGHGWDYKSFANYGTGNFEDFGKKLINDFDKWNEHHKEEKIMTLSMLDLSKVSNAQAQWNNFLEKYGSDKNGIQQILAARATAREFSHGEAADKRNEEVDLADFLSKFNTTEAQALLKSLDEIVLYKNQANTMEGVNGLSVFIPGENVWTYSQNRDDVAANNLSEGAAKTLDRIASVFAGKKDSMLFGETWSDQKHLGTSGDYRNTSWFDADYAALGGLDTYSYNKVPKGGFAVESKLGLKADQLLDSELRVMLKDNQGYINLGRIDNFSQTKGTKNPVFNFNGQWPHINGQPVMIYQYGEFDVDGQSFKNFYTMVNVNGSPKKLQMQWNATEKQWSVGGYVDENTELNGRSEMISLQPGDKLQFLYEVTSDGKKVERETVFADFAYDPASFGAMTKKIEQNNTDVIFHGTVTDSYGKTYTTPYFKIDEETNKVTTENLNGGGDVIEESQTPNNEAWEISDPNSFLTCSYDSATGAYVPYTEDTDAYNVVVADPNDDFRVTTRSMKNGFRYDSAKDKFYSLDENGEKGEGEFTAQELALYVANLGLSYNDILALLQEIVYISEKGDWTDEELERLAFIYNAFDGVMDNYYAEYAEPDVYGGQTENYDWVYVSNQTGEYSSDEDPYSPSYDSSDSYEDDLDDDDYEYEYPDDDWDDDDWDDDDWNDDDWDDDDDYGDDSGSDDYGDDGID